ncbi:hypothetical protein BBO99_00006360 [Phytophthora kernoviae]|uniref:Protein kinase domain-containing protein n=2 Tax=Phytophthora kernoviae TaxID=325452 RepID=A0A3R7K5X5_9STRA|nr:hypothetical protein G195_009655 [Phytophthora kernoviae 00238/432]KAG2521781.1 hypothetical protein JM16_006139 [Phytophthora kernoviae]KAG2523146.1 hypothetical protein JM18_005829 [Phytophthora kernoviae]RLN21515.1 hypothetical protein BBI17_005611 [Phytophthora kernoviae]RLN77919.1 hypothetical protein BBO99_00006360 [Phytophthora kernoviae]
MRGGHTQSVAINPNDELNQPVNPVSFARKEYLGGYQLLYHEDEEDTHQQPLLVIEYPLNRPSGKPFSGHVQRKVDSTDSSSDEAEDVDDDEDDDEDLNEEDEEVEDWNLGDSGRDQSPCKSAPSPGPSSPTAAIRDTKVVKKKKAELPQHNLPHPVPKFGDWLNSRTMINNYIILEQLGAGGYAEVKLCKEKLSGKLFAMKFISRDVMKKDKVGKQGKLDDIKREIAIMKKLNHPNVLRLYEVMDDPKMNKLFLVLEYMKHGDMLSYQKKKHPQGMLENLRDRDLHSVFLQVILGLAYLHEQKIVHGDIKPQNLLVGEKEVVKIADFGISQSLYGSKQKIADVAGTPAFMSPEMCSGEEYSGQLADVWALGATIFMLKFGNPPFLAKSALQMVLSNEEIDYRSQLFSRKKLSNKNALEMASTGGGDVPRRGSVTAHAQPIDHVLSDGLDDEDALSDEDDELAVSQSPQLLDELLLTTLSMPPLTKTAGDPVHMPSLFVSRNGVGDCRLVLSKRDGRTVELTQDHRLTLAIERERVIQLGGRVINNRVNGVMAITRAFGDLEFKGMLDRHHGTGNSSGSENFGGFGRGFREDEKVPPLLTAKPDVHDVELDANEDAFLILACDGLWDVITSEEATEILRDRIRLHGDLQLAALELAQEGIRRYSNDNITVIAILLQPPNLIAHHGS